jgi:hypothetical protein
MGKYASGAREFFKRELKQGTTAWAAVDANLTAGKPSLL